MGKLFRENWIWIAAPVVTVVAAVAILLLTTGNDPAGDFIYKLN